MKIYNNITIINNKYDQSLLRDRLSLYHVFTWNALDIKQKNPEYINYFYDDTIAEIRKIQKQFIIYGYVYAIGYVGATDFGGDINDLIKIIYDMSFDSSRVWITNKKFSWCIEINTNYICFSYSPFCKLINQIKNYHKLN